MSLRFILGTAGTGKTTYCLSSLREKILSEPDGSTIILLAPEQAAFQLERELALSGDVEGLMRVHVLSFRRLAWRVFRDVGGASRVHIGELGKKMVLRKLLENHRNELSVFAHVSHQLGFLDTLSNMISESKRYLLTSAQISASTGYFDISGQKLISNKLHDISLIFRKFEDFLADKAIDPDDYLTLLANKLPEAEIVKDAEVWIDGFTGFTPQEYLVLEALMTQCSQVNIALPLEPESLENPSEDETCFYTTKETYSKLIEICEKIKLDVLPPVVLPVNEEKIAPRFINSPDIAHLEKRWCCASEVIFEKEVNNIKLAAAVNRRAEVEWVAREILALSRERGFRWKDIGVILRDFEEYQELIATVFAEMGIAFFIDSKRDMRHHPLIEVVLSSIQIINDNWSYEPLFRCLKTDFFPLSRDQVDQLENYVIMHGIKGRVWTDKNSWKYHRKKTLGEENEISQWEEEELDNINKIRNKIQDLLLGFSSTFKEAANVKEMTIALYTLLEKLKVDITLQKWKEAAETAGEIERAREHSQIYEAVLQVLEEIVEALGSEKIDTSEYLKILEAGLHSIRLGLIPPGLDQVMVFSLGRSRIPNIKAGFVLGVNDGAFPKRPASEGMLTEQEREQLNKVGIELAPSEDKVLLDEDYLIYVSFTRASDYLCISYPLADQEGKALLPSMLIKTIQNTFPKLQKQLWVIEPIPGEEALEFIAAPESSLPLLVKQIRFKKEGSELHPMWPELYNWYLKNSYYKDKLESALKGIFWINQEQPLSAATGSLIFKKDLKTSVSRLEKFRQCPFSHFLNYGLKLRKRDEYKLEALDYGEFYHAALKDYFEYLQKEQLDYERLSDEQVESIMRDVVVDLAPQLQSEMLLSSKRYHHLTKKLERILQQSAKILMQHAKRSQFRPVALEEGFGYENSKLPALKIDLEQGSTIELIGRIDRVDVASSEEDSYITVIDYKSGDISIGLDEIYHGLRLQLLAYLLVCLENSELLGFKNAKPGGILYFRVHNPTLKWETSFADDERLKSEFLKKFKMRGILLAEKELIQLMDKELESGTSPFFSVGINRDGSFSKTSALFTEENFNILKEHIKELIRKTGSEILDGKVDIKPYVKGKKKACEFCPYKSICQFDVLFKGNDYVVLDSLADKDIWQLLNPSKEDDVDV